jgi:hypothetical protein
MHPLENLAAVWWNNMAFQEEPVKMNAFTSQLVEYG